jgi:transposase-like protein
MARRVFDNPGIRAWWQIHVEAYRLSRLTIAKYCSVHGLARGTFNKWRRELTDWEAQKSANAARRRGQWTPVSKEKRRQATQAFWAMHVEAWIWSGLHLRDYAMTHRLSTHSLKRWRNIFDNEEVVIDWRTYLHPSALPLIGTKIGPSAKEKEEAARLTAVIEADAPPPRRAVRRRWTTEEKIALLLQAERHGSTISSVGQAHGISTSVLFRWRDQLGMGKEKPLEIVPVRVVEAHDRSIGGAPSLLADLLPKPDGMVEVALPDGRLVFAPVGVDPEAVRREVAAREQQP